MTNEIEYGDTILYKDPPDGHFIPCEFMAVVVATTDSTVDIDCGNGVVTTLVKDYCQKLTKKEYFTRKLQGGTFDVKS